MEFKELAKNMPPLKISENIEVGVVFVNMF